MGYWIHVEELPVSGGGGGGGGGNGWWKGCLGCAGFLAVLFALWFLKQPGALAGLVRRLLTPATIVLLVASVGIIIKVIAEAGFDKEVLIPGVIGLGAGFVLGVATVAGNGGSGILVIGTGLMIGVIVAAPAMLFGADGFDLGGVIAGIVGFGAGAFLGYWSGGSSFNIGIIAAAFAIDLYFCWEDLLD